MAMISGFYEILGVEPKAGVGEVRVAYGEAVGRLVRRRKTLVEKGGDTAQLDQARDQLDEAWAVLSDPVRRRRYDAMLAWVSEDRGNTGDVLWEAVAPVLAHPAAAVAAKLLRVTTHLTEIGPLPLGPSSQEDAPPTLVPHDEDLTSPRIAPAARLGRVEPPAALGAVVSLPTAGHSVPEPTLRVVDGTPAASEVILLSADTPRAKLDADPPLRPEPPATPASLVEAHGYTGALLRATREARRISLQDMAESTRISVRYLEAIEADRFDTLPSATFVRGYVREMARMLQLDDEAVVQGYMRRFSG